MEGRLLDRSLRRYRNLDSNSIEESRAVLAREICPHDLLQSTPGPLRTRHDRLHFHASSLHHVSYGLPVRIVNARIDDEYLVLIPSGGTSEVVIEGHRIAAKEGSGAILAPGSRFDVFGDAAARLLVWRIPEARLRDTAADHGRVAVGVAALSFGSAPAMAFLRTLHFAIGEARAWDGRAGEGGLSRRIEDLLLFSFLRAQYEEGEVDGYESVLPACVWLVERFVAAHVQEEVGMADLVAASGVSERSLHRAFRHFRGGTPMAHLRTARLRRVRSDLLDPRARDSVTDIQMRWGVTEFGRFAAAYRRAYGELPSATLRAARR